MFFKVLICVLLPLLASSFVIKTEGEKGFKLLGTGSRGLRYYLSAHKTNQTNAASECQNAFSGKLVSILNGVEDADISKLLQSDFPSGFVYTSGTRTAVGEPFIWRSMTPQLPATHFKWAPGNPNSIASSLCIIVGHNVGVYQWYASECSSEARFICEI